MYRVGGLHNVRKRFRELDRKVLMEQWRDTLEQPMVRPKQRTPSGTKQKKKPRSLDRVISLDMYKYLPYLHYVVLVKISIKFYTLIH